MKSTVLKELVKDGVNEDQEIHFLVGCDLSKCLRMQQSWSKSFADILEYLESTQQNFDFAEIYQKGLQDSHWDWPKKAIHLNNDDYIWFSLESGADIEATMVICHPKHSKKDSRQFFYVDYFAVAPWNRTPLVGQPKFRGLGTKLLKLIGKYISDTYHYPEGFSLHSLPQALSYYEHIGMVNFGADPLKSELHYLEMEQLRAKDFYYE